MAYLKTLRDDLWDLIRWRVEHDAFHSSCDARVLYGVAKKCAEGLRALGYYSSEPPENRERAIYIDWITENSREARSALDRWEIPDCAITRATPIYQEAADRVKNCRVASEAIESDGPVIHPAGSE